MNTSGIIAIVGVVLITFLGLISLDAKNDREENTKQMTACVQAGGDWQIASGTRYTEHVCVLPKK